MAAFPISFRVLELGKRDGGLERVVNLSTIPSAVFVRALEVFLCESDNLVFIGLDLILRTPEVDEPNLLGCFPIQRRVWEKGQLGQQQDTSALPTYSIG